jgi:hypothetical protein
MMKAPLSSEGTRGKHAQEGSAIVMVLVVLLIVSAICTDSLVNSMALMRLSQRQVWREQNHYAAESGLEEAARMINGSTYLGAGDTEFTITLANGISADVVISLLNSQGKEFSVASGTSDRGIPIHLGISRIYRPTYLDYGHFYEDFRNLWWIYGEIVDGKVWTGTQQNIYGYRLGNGQKWGPVFRYTNQTDADSFGGYPDYAAYLDPSISWGDAEYGDLQFWDSYEDGYELEVSKPALLDTDFDGTKHIAGVLDVDPALIDPTTVSPANMPTGRALLLRGKTEVRFTVQEIAGEEVGIVEIRNRDKFGNFNWNPLYSEALDIIYVERQTTGPGGHRGAKVTLGDSVHHTPNILKGNLTLWAEDDITIPTHVIYNNQNLEESTDKIGVISKDDIWVDRKFTGDLVLQGGYIATGAVSGRNRGELGLIDYDKFGVRGYLYFTGSMVAERVYPFGVFSGSTFVSGFQTEHTFDPRFLTNPPPFTPTIDSEVEYEGWY